MRVTTAFNKMLGLVGASVASVTFTPEGSWSGCVGARAKHRCPCGWRTWAIYDRSMRRWRHLDLGATRCFLEAEIARIDCARCGRVRTEEVPWARPGARHTSDLQDVVAWLAQRIDKTTITRVAADQLGGGGQDRHRRGGRGHRRHPPREPLPHRGRRGLLSQGAPLLDRRGRPRPRGRGRLGRRGQRPPACSRPSTTSSATERTRRLEAISLDMGGAYKSATDTQGTARDPVRGPVPSGQAGQRGPRQDPTLGLERGSPARPAPAPPRGRPRWKHTRWAPLQEPRGQAHPRASPEVLALSCRLDVPRAVVLYRGWQLKEAVRDLYRLRRPRDAPEHLDWWLCWAQSLSDPRLREAGQDRRGQPRAHPRRGRTRPVELQTRGTELEGPPHQPPRLRAPQRGRPHRHDLPLLRWDHVELPTHRVLSGRIDPRKPEENPIFSLLLADCVDDAN